MLHVKPGIIALLKFSLGEICLSEGLGTLEEALQALFRGQLGKHSCREGLRLH